MTIAIVASTVRSSSTPVTTDAIDTTGATKIILSVGVNHSNPVSVSDNQGNTYTQLTQYTGGSQRVSLYYCDNPIVGASHTFTVTGGFAVVGVLAISGSASAFESVTGNASATASTTLQPGSLTPSVDGALLITGLNNASGSAATINSGFTAVTTGFSAGIRIGGGIGYLIQSTAAAVNPTWSWTANSQRAATMIVVLPTTFTLSSSSSIQNATVSLTATGSGTNWSSPTGLFTVSGGTGASISNISVVDADTATFDLQCGSAIATLTITDTSTGATRTFSVLTSALTAGTLTNLTITGSGGTFSLATNINGTTPYSNQLQRSPAGAGTWANIGSPVSGSTASLSDTTASPGTSYDYRVFVSDAGVETATSNTVTIATTYPVTTSDIFYSPYNWYLNGTTFIQSNNPGAYIKARFTGASFGMIVDTSPLVSGGVSAASYPTISYSVDGGAWTRYQLVSSDTAISLASSLSSGSHTIEIHFVASALSPDRWNNPTSVLRITGFILASGQSFSAPTLRPGRCIIYGDSDSEGQENVAAGVSVANQDAQQAWAAIMGDALECEYGVVGFASQGYTATGNGNVPTLPNAWDYYHSGVSRLVGGLFSPAPDFVICGHGTNDGSSIPAATVETLIPLWRAAAPLAKILICTPKNNPSFTDATSGVDGSGDSNSYTVSHDTSLVGMAYQVANPGHLNRRGATRFGARLAAKARKLTASGGAGFPLSRIVN